MGSSSVLFGLCSVGGVVVFDGVVGGEVDDGSTTMRRSVGCRVERDMLNPAMARLCNGQLDPRM